MKTIFIDTSAWLALINKSDEFHEKAKLVRDGLVEKNARFVMTDYIIVEIANCFSRIPFREAAIKLIESIRNSEDIEVVRVNEDIFEKAWDLYSSRKDKEWGFTDCTSFVVMRENGIKEAFSADHHFEQAGFKILLKK